MSVFATGLRKALSQGDIISNVSIGEPHLGLDLKPFTVMAVSHGCEIDKKHNKFMLVASVRPLTHFNPGDHDRIRNGETLALFYLPPPDAHGVERCVDFRQTFRVSFDAVGATAFETVNGEDLRVFPSADPRTSSLSDHGQHVLQGRIVAFYTRSRDMEPQPPA